MKRPELPRVGFWRRLTFNPRTALGWRWEVIQEGWGDQRRGEGRGRRMALPGAVRAAAVGLIRLQGNRYGAVIASGAKIADASGIGESTWWDIARPELQKLGMIQTVERGGGRIPGGNGRANVYMSPDAGVEEAEPRPAAPYRLELTEDQRATWRPLAPLLEQARARAPT